MTRKREANSRMRGSHAATLLSARPLYATDLGEADAGDALRDGNSLIKSNGECDNHFATIRIAL
jgi:hypothetical protein